VGFIGLGAMGTRMAENLRRSGYGLVVHDTSIAALDAFCKHEGVESVSTPAAVAEEEGIIITMLPSCKHVMDVYCGTEGILSAEGSPLAPHCGTRPSLFIDSSTINPVTAQKLAQKVSETSLHRESQPFPGCSARSPMMVDAPVSGGITGASAATLTFMCGGDRNAVSAAGPFLKSMGKKSWHCGAAGMGQAAKVCNNLALAIQMVSIAEAAALGGRLGMDPKLLADIFNSSSARCWTSDSYHPVPGVMADVPASKGYKDGFATRLMIKDLGLAISAAEHAGSATPMANEVLKLYQKVAEDADDRLDFGAIYRYVYNGDAADASGGS
ncbi:3-hydroxyisobutyrate dehydrogenase-like protein, partial [Coccomyxa subellipsoidea C-169]